MEQGFTNIELEIKEELYERIATCAEQRNISFDEMFELLLDQGVALFKNNLLLRHNEKRIDK